MEIVKRQGSSSLELELHGRLNAVTAPQLDAELMASLDGITRLTLDLTGLQYISSAGLRVLLKAQKTMNKQGSMRLIHANSDIMDVFMITGFADILNIE